MLALRLYQQRLSETAADDRHGAASLIGCRSSPDRRLVRPAHPPLARLDARRPARRQAGDRAPGSASSCPRRGRPTVGDVVSRVREALVDTAALLDEIVVIDSDSTDDTYDVATRRRARSCTASAEIRPDLGTVPGQGRGDVEVAVRHRAATCWCSWTPTCSTGTPTSCPGCSGRCSTRPEVALVKGFYERPMLRRRPATGRAFEGGRVTELVARPLIALLFPELAGLVQPLAGEWAVRRVALRSAAGPDRVRRELAALVDTVRGCSGSTRSPRSTSAAAPTGTRRCATSARWRPRSSPPSRRAAAGGSAPTDASALRQYRPGDGRSPPRRHGAGRRAAARRQRLAGGGPR